MVRVSQQLLDMEKLKSVVPKALQQIIAESTPHDLPSTCSSLLDFFQQLPLFHQIVRDLTDPETSLCRKNKEAGLELKRKGNECYSRREYSDALRLYSEALRVTPADADDTYNNLVATLYVNRATVLRKMDFQVESLQDCNRALLISPSYAKGWYRRGQANASLRKYEESASDLNVSINMELSLSGKKQIEKEMRLILDQPKESSSLSGKTSENNMDFPDESHKLKVQCVFTPTKGRAMASQTDIPQASLIHTEEPFAAIILKQCRDTHCHFCFNELPMDTVPCSSCSIPLYCSQQCQIQAGGKMGNDSKNNSIQIKLPNDLKKYIEKITLSNSSCKCIPEHLHECQGVHWSAILPSEIVLIGRVLVKYIEQQRQFGCVTGLKDLCHHYVQLSSEEKMELHIYSIILLYCLQLSYGAELPVSGVMISQCVILGSQIRVNSMAVFRMKSFDVDGKLDCSGKYSAGDALTTSLEQIRVGQALYLTGSLFNHSCMPNIHAYFISRTLYIRSTEIIVEGSPLELSYGPQVGQLDCKERRQFLEHQYSFKCQCTGCSELNLSDLVLNAYRCIKQDCLGVVLDKCMAEYQKNNVDKFESNGIDEVVSHVANHGGWGSKTEPGYCLKCGSYRDLKVSHASINKAWSYIKRLEDAIVSGEISAGRIFNYLRYLDLLRSILHAYNKKIAEVEDRFARAFCLVGELQPALDHCKASILILEKLYGSHHIAIGNELVKLVSIQLLLGDSAAIDSINQLAAIFWQYYGPQADIIFPHLQFLKREALSLV